MQVHVGEVWAYRERISDRSSPLVPAEILQIGPSRSWKVRVRWKGGEYEGLDQWASARRLLVLWEEADAWRTDEDLYASVREASMDAGFIEYRAAWHVVLGADSLVGFETYEPNHGAIIRVPNLAAACEDLGLNMQALLDEPLAFVDRHGEYVAPWPVALRLAKHTAARRPEAVLAAISREERDLQKKSIHGEKFRWRKTDPEMFVPPEVYANQLLEWQPIFALIREWCGAAPIDFDRVAALEQEILRLRGAMEYVAEDLRRRHHKLAAKLVNLMDVNSEESLEMKDRKERWAKLESAYG